MSPAASDLRALHVPGSPLVLPNAWDAASARLVEEAGFPVVATSSAAVARVLGSEDHEAMSAEDALAAVTRIAGAVSVPVTADFEGGYGLAPDAIAYGLLGAGACGCNIEDTDHRGPGPLVDPATHAARLAALRAAAGDALVINARVDTFARRVPNPVDEAIERGRRYLDAGADCIYPILATGSDVIARLVAEIDAPLNVMVRPGGLRPDELVELGARRITWGGGLIEVALAAAAAEVTQGRAAGD